MAFRKEYTVYENLKSKVRVYINQCHAKGRKTNIYAIRRDDKSGCGCFLGMIYWSGRWRQYVSEFDRCTQWSSSCKKKIAEFEDMINKIHRNNLKKKKSKLKKK